MSIKIYELRDPRDLECKPRYVGITKNSLKRRLSNHLSKSALNYKTHKIHWLNKILKENISPTIHLIEEVETWEYACKIEMYWIKEFKVQGYVLTNSTEGGEGAVGAVVSEETRRKIGEKSKGRFCSEETRKKRSKALKGRKFSEEYCQKLSKLRKGRKLSEECKRKISKASKGRIVSQELREQLSKSHKGKKISKEAKLKMSNSKKGRIISEETKIRMGIAQRKRACQISQYDINGAFIKNWNSVLEISLFLHCSKSAIYAACSKDTISFGYKWKYKLIKELE